MTTTIDDIKKCLELERSINSIIKLNQIAPQEFFDGTGPELADKLTKAGLWLCDSGHEAATSRLLPMIEKAIEIAEFYGNETNYKEFELVINAPVITRHMKTTKINEDEGKKAREFQAFLAELAAGGK